MSVLNFYVYTKGDPVNYVDRTGLLIDVYGNFVRGPIWDEKFYFEMPDNYKPPLNLIVLIAMQALQDLYCVSYLSGKEWAFHIKIDNDGPGTGGNYLQAVNPNTLGEFTKSDPGYTKGATVAVGHTHMWDGFIYDKNGVYQFTIGYPKGASQADYNALKYSRNLGFIADMYGNLYAYKLTGKNKEERVDSRSGFFYKQLLNCTCRE